MRKLLFGLFILIPFLGFLLIIIMPDTVQRPILYLKTPSGAQLPKGHSIILNDTVKAGIIGETKQLWSHNITEFFPNADIAIPEGSSITIREVDKSGTQKARLIPGSGSNELLWGDTISDVTLYSPDSLKKDTQNKPDSVQ